MKKNKINIINNKMNKLNYKIDNTNDNKPKLLSIDEMSIITNRTPTKGWALKNKECIINLPDVKPNKRYSLLIASSNNKIVKYLLVEKSIKTDTFIKFLNELHNENKNYTYLIDNASIHRNKTTFMFYKEKKLNVVYNAPYQSKFNPIEMVFSLLRKKLNKEIVKDEDSINNVIKMFIENIKKETLENIFNHSIKILKVYLKKT